MFSQFYTFFSNSQWALKSLSTIPRPWAGVQRKKIPSCYLRHEEHLHRTAEGMTVLVWDVSSVCVCVSAHTLNHKTLPVLGIAKHVCGKYKNMMRGCSNGPRGYVCTQVSNAKALRATGVSAVQMVLWFVGQRTTQHRLLTDSFFRQTDPTFVIMVIIIHEI